jgi:hypothetical protein
MNEILVQALVSVGLFTMLIIVAFQLINKISKSPID